MKKSDLIAIGQKYHKLTVFEFSHNNKSVDEWICLCACGGLVIVTCYNLLNGSAKSCSCLRYRVKHGAQVKGSDDAKLYKTWTAMKMRCLNERDKAYKYYGGRGIKVSTRWLNFLNFKKDMGQRACGMTLERKNNNLGYSKKNCRWATRKEQSRNTRRSVFISISGENKTIAEWSEISGIHKNTLFKRLSNNFNEKTFLNKPRSRE
jgi:hypothetical protein